MSEMIRARGLVKRYKGVEALRGLDLTVPEGTVLGLLGPNGAGKTTAVRCLATLLKIDGGSAEIAGVDVASNPEEVRRRIGLSGQYAAVDEHLTGYENLEMVGRLYGMKKAKAQARSRELLDRFDLTDAGDRPSKTYSGGMRRRLDLAGALVAEPPVLILDEPTTGLDPRSRQQMWDVIRELVSDGATLLLTTQYLEEADRLADDIIVIDHGLAIAQGTADELKAQTGGERIELIIKNAADHQVATAILAQVAIGEIAPGDNGRSFNVAVEGGTAALARVVQQINEQQIDVLDLGLRRPTLDDVFLSLTGHAAESDQSTDGSEAEAS